MMAETPTSSSSSIALHHTVAKDRTTSVKTTEPELPTLLSEKLHIDQVYSRACGDRMIPSANYVESGQGKQHLSFDKDACP